ncbi:MAG: transcriptional regulator [Candidatus Heimdallarchaeota archaeon]|nr:MAG: transcriptional regulator [Candidatus Heimdallarchaeota archaeon]
MLDFLNDFGELIWIILPLAALQLLLLAVSLWEWNRKKVTLGQNKLIWLLIIVFINFIGPIAFLIYTQRINTVDFTKETEVDEWSV